MHGVVASRMSATSSSSRGLQKCSDTIHAHRRQWLRVWNRSGMLLPILVSLPRVPGRLGGVVRSLTALCSHLLVVRASLKAFVCRVAENEGGIDDDGSDDISSDDDRARRASRTTIAGRAIGWVALTCYRPSSGGQLCHRRPCGACVVKASPSFAGTRAGVGRRSMRRGVKRGV